VERHVIDLIQKVMNRPASQINKDQALVPSKCTVLHNQVGTAPGMWMKRKKYGVYFTTRSSLQMKYLVEHEIIPKVVREYASPIHRTILTYGQGESVVAERIEDWENNLPGVSN
jgi:nicotinamide-nucleotide amidase